MSRVREEEDESVPLVLPSQMALQLLPHRRYDDAQLLLFAGKRGRGKTYALRWYIEKREPRVLALDVFNDFRGLVRSPSLEDALEDLSEGGPCRRRIRPPLRGSRRWANGDEQKGIIGAWEMIIDEDTGLRDCLLVLDEITLFSSPMAVEALQAIVLQGRRMGIRLAVACQRISLVPGVFLSEMTELLVFRMTRPRDLVVLADWTNRRTAKIARKLTRGRCVLCSDL